MADRHSLGGPHHDRVCLVQFQSHFRCGSDHGSVIAIHGLDTNSERTWMAYAVEGDLSSEQVHWLQNHVMLPSRIPYARIFTFDWNANSHSDAAIDDLLGHATSFLQQISLSRPAVGVACKSSHFQLTL